MSQTAVVIPAAGRGTRMKSQLPKVLHRLCGKPMVAHVLDAVRAAGFGPIVVVVGHGAAEVAAACGTDVTFAEQKEQLGTGHAVRVALPYLPNSAEIREVVVVFGECPLIDAETLAKLVERHRAGGAAVTLATGELPDPTGIGRIARDAAGRFRAIVEEAVASPEEKLIREINGGCFCFDAAFLHSELPSLPLRPKGEYYLTDLAERAIERGLVVETLPADGLAITGINDRAHLAICESAMRARINRRLMLSGVTMVDPSSTYVDADVVVEPDTVIHPNTYLRGQTVIGTGSEIGPNSEVVDTQVGANCRVWASVLESATLEADATIGPFSHLRPGAYLESGADLGNYAEVKNSRIGSGTLMHHFSYIGDAEIGRNVNIGAGTITCNYDTETKEKSRTVVEDGVSLGSDTMLVAPVRIGERARTGAGAVVTRDVAPKSVVVGVPAKPIREVSP